MFLVGGVICLDALFGSSDGKLTSFAFAISFSYIYIYIYVYTHMHRDDICLSDLRLEPSILS